MILDREALAKAFELHPRIHADMLEDFLIDYLLFLPKPEAPYEQAILYRKMTGMEK